MKRRLALPLAALAGLAALVISASCSKTLAPARHTQSPHTLLFVDGTLDTVNHIVHLYWFGTDPSGYLKGYQVHLLNPAAPADTAWRFTTRTDTVLTVFTPAGLTSPVFQVRAVSENGAVDPHPPSQTFYFRNLPPIVTLILKPGRVDSTYASVTVTWRVVDPDGDASRVLYRVWLDGRESAPDFTPATTYTVPSDRFLVGGTYPSGMRTLHVRAIDDGGMAGGIDSVTWYVKQPCAGNSLHGRLLIVDDVPRGNNLNGSVDQIYMNAAAAVVPAGLTSILRLDMNPNIFRSADDLTQTFKLFDAVVWYRANEIATATTLNSYGDGIGPYLEGGGKFYLDGLYLFSGQNQAGALDESFVTRYLDCTGMRKNFQTVTAFSDSTIGWSNSNGSMFYSTLFADSSRQQLLASHSGQAGGFTVFNVRQKSEVAFLAQPGSLRPVNSDSCVVGVSVAQPGGGRAIVFSLPLATSTPLSVNGTATRIMTKVLRDAFGLGGP